MDKDTDQAYKSINCKSNSALSMLNPTKIIYQINLLQSLTKITKS